MGLFGDIGSFFGGAAKAVATGGISLIAPKLIPAPINRALDVVTKAQFPTTLSGLGKTAGLVAAPLTGGLSIAIPPQATSTGFYPGIRQPIVGTKGVQPMAFNLGGLLGGLGSIFGQEGNIPSVQGFGNVLTAVSSGFAPPMGVGQPMVIPVGSRLPAVRAPSLTQEVFNAGVKILGALGIPYAATAGGFSSALRRTLGSIGSLARRTPAGTIVSILLGLGLTAYESNLLVAWHSQRKRGRRMNPGNVKALRRAARRIESFHKTCIRIDRLRGPRRGRTRSAPCGTCRKNPCRC